MEKTPYLWGLYMRGLFTVKIQLPDGRNHDLDENLSLEEKLKAVEQLTIEWMPAIKKGWNNNTVKFFLDSLANYIVWHKENREEGKKGTEDKFVLSKKKVDKMSNYRKDSKTINFSDLSPSDREILLGDSEVLEDE